MADVVKMNVFLVGDSRKGGAMDFEGLMKAYNRHFGRGQRRETAGAHDRAGRGAADPRRARRDRGRRGTRAREAGREDAVKGAFP